MQRKVFCVSFHKSGTTSLHRFLVDAGLTSRHYPRDHEGMMLRSRCKPTMGGAEILDILKPILDKYDCHSDAPWPGLMPEILQRYPNAQIILLTRDPEEWWRSLARHWRLQFVPCALSNFEQIQYRGYLGRKRVISLTDREVVMQAYKTHIHRVRQLVPPGQLFEATLNDPALGEKLSRFLGLASPMPFPQVQNKTASQPLLMLARRYWRYLHNLPAQWLREHLSVR